MFSGISQGIYYVLGLTTLTLNGVVKHRYIILLSTSLYTIMCSLWLQTCKCIYIYYVKAYKCMYIHDCTLLLS